MTWFVETFLDLIDAAALALLLAFACGILVRSTELTFWHKLLGGVVFGGGSYLAMLSPVEFTQGFLIDLRAAFIVLSAAFLGWQAGMITLLITILARTWFFPFPSLGWSLMAWVYLGLAGQYLAALAWRHFSDRFTTNIFISAAALVLLTQGTALALTNWKILLPVPSIDTILLIQYAARSFGLLLAGTVMLREQKLAKRDAINQILAHRDALTGLLNRRGLERKLKNCASYDSFAVFCVDFDNFKYINDTFGHDAGDALLEAGARGFRHALPAAGFMCRFGGDEFVGVVPDLSLEDAQSTAEDLVSVIRTVVPISLRQSHVSVSVGFSRGKSDIGLRALLNRADAALYRAKSEGGNCAVSAPEIAQSSGKPKSEIFGGNRCDGPVSRNSQTDAPGLAVQGVQSHG